MKKPRSDLTGPERNPLDCPWSVSRDTRLDFAARPAPCRTLPAWLAGYQRAEVAAAAEHGRRVRTRSVCVRTARRVGQPAATALPSPFLGLHASLGSGRSRAWELSQAPNRHWTLAEHDEEKHDSDSVDATKTIATARSWADEAVGCSPTLSGVRAAQLACGCLSSGIGHWHGLQTVTSRASRACG